MIRALIVDDELPAREELSWLLEQIGGVELIGTASDAKEAMERISDEPVELIFLDIDMPGIDGMRLAEAIHGQSGPKPQIVFVTAYQERAIDAFGVDAVDYILKPARIDRLRSAIEKVKNRLQQSVVQDGVEAKVLTRISVEKRGVFHVVPVEEILCFEVDGGIVMAQTETERYMTDFNLKYLEESLDPEVFYRCHRSYIVKIAAITSMVPVGAGTYQLTIRGMEDPLPLARSRASGLKTLIPSS